MKRRGIVSIAALLALALSFTGVAYAQVNGTVQGFVFDESGAVLPGVTIQVTNQATGVSRTVVTNEEGFYTTGAVLRSGVHNVTASLEGMQSVQKTDIPVLTGQTLSVDFELGVETVTELITVTGDAPVIETSRSSAAAYVSEEEIEALPISDRDFKEFAFLAPTVQNDPIRGFVTMSGQRGTYTALNIDGTDAKSAFFGYGRGGEATENDGLVIAQDSVQEFQVTTSGFAPEYGESGGGYINVVTKSGTNQLKGSAFYFFRNEGMAEDIPASPLDQFNGRTADTPVDDFDRKTYGGSIGGPISKDRTFYFFSFDQVNRDQPFRVNFDCNGCYDAVLARAAIDPRVVGLLDGLSPNSDGVAAPDPVNGRTASGNFVREVDNLILFGKVDHQFSESQSGTFRFNITDFERASDWKDEESLKTEETTSFVASLVSVIGSNAINEARLQLADDQLDRLSKRVGEPIEAQVRFRGRDARGASGSLGKFDFLPIFVEEDKMQFQDNFSYLFGDHDLKFGLDYQSDDLAQLFAGSLDGRYDFNTLQDFINNNASTVRIYFGDVTYPNYDETQEVISIYGQDSWRPNADLTINYGLRYSRTDNPDGLAHIFPEGRSIPDDTDNWQPRVGFAWSIDEVSVLRGGIGIFTSRTPSLIFASQVQQNGLYPNFGRVNVSPGDIGFVPFGDNIDNENPPLDSPNSPSFVAPDFEDPETTRLNLGYERQVGNGWVAGADLVWAETDNLQSNIDLNRVVTFDQFGRPINLPGRPQAEFNEIFTRQSVGESEYQALTLRINKRFNGRYQFNAHYTYAEDKDTDSNERTATSVTVSVPTNPMYDWGFSERDVKNRLLVSGLVELPYGFRVSGIAEYRSGTPYNPTDAGFDFVACGFTSLGFNCPDARPVVHGQVVPRNDYRNDSIERIDLRLSKAFAFADRYEVEIFAEVFNLLDENTFFVGGGFDADNERDPTSNTFGLADNLVTTPRQFQLGARFRF